MEHNDGDGTSQATVHGHNAMQVRTVPCRGAACLPGTMKHGELFCDQSGGFEMEGEQSSSPVRTSVARKWAGLDMDGLGVDWLAAYDSVWPPGRNRG
jgi:hypothetical protein